jgi:hypothetical protein
MNAVTGPPPQPNCLPISKKTLDDIANRFTYRAPKGTQQERYVAIRAAGFDFDLGTNGLLGEGGGEGGAEDEKHHERT